MPWNERFSRSNRRKGFLREIRPAPQLGAPKRGRNPRKFQTAVWDLVCRTETPPGQTSWSNALFLRGPMRGRHWRRCWASLRRMWWCGAGRLSRDHSRCAQSAGQVRAVCWLGLSHCDVRRPLPCDSSQAAPLASVWKVRDRWLNERRVYRWRVRILWLLEVGPPHARQ